jgi:predicted metal-dependent phosphoesterase TrpH
MTLKIDFHIHTGEDPKDRDIRYSAKELLDKAAAYDFHALTIANHGDVLYTTALREYASRRGILLIPGTEAKIEGKHVLIVNCETPCPKDLKFSELRAYVGEQALIIAPHPFYPRSYCLQDDLERYIHVFDAIEYAHLHFRFFNLNKKAVALAHTYHLPLVGTSDAHSLFQLNTTYSLVDVDAAIIPAIVEAVRNHRVRVVTRPLSSWIFLKKSLHYLWGLVWKNKSDL